MMYLKQVYSCFEVGNKPVQCVICFTWAREKSSCFIVDAGVLWKWSAGVLWKWSAAATVAANWQTSLLPFYCITHDTKKNRQRTGSDLGCYSIRADICNYCGQKNWPFFIAVTSLENCGGGGMLSSLILFIVCFVKRVPKENSEQATRFIEA